jgi:SOS-response transcriptional repressor LexA
MKTKALTNRQEKVLDAILTQVNTFGYPPTIRELRDITKIKSTRGVTLQLDALEESGYITRSSKARGIKINPALLNSKSTKKVKVPLAEEEEKISIPLMASPIPAGYASMVEEFSDSTTEVSIRDTKGVENIFAVKGHW